MRFYCKLSACLGVAVAYGLLLWLAPFSVFAFLTGLPVCFFLAAALHELGHLLAYKLLGLSWKRMVISFLEFQPGKGVHVNRQQKLFAAGCTCVYDKAVPYWRYRIALLSGGLTCLLLAAAALPWGIFAGGGLRSFLLCFGGVCALNALASLLPFSTDRRLLRQIKQERE